MIAHNLQFPVAANAAVPAEQESGECTKLIRKLRWIGLDEEAKHLEEALRTLTPDQRDTVLADPANTD